MQLLGFTVSHRLLADLQISRQDKQAAACRFGQEVQEVFRFQLPASLVARAWRRSTLSSVTLRHACLPRTASRTRCLQPTQRDVTCPYTQDRDRERERERGTLELELIRNRVTGRMVTVEKQFRPPFAG